MVKKQLGKVKSWNVLQMELDELQRYWIKAFKSGLEKYLNNYIYV